MIKPYSYTKRKGYRAEKNLNIDGKRYRKGQFIPKQFTIHWQIKNLKQQQKRLERDRQRAKEFRNRGKSFDPTPEIEKDAMRERIEFVFKDFTQDDWDDIKSLEVMKRQLDARKTFLPTEYTDKQTGQKVRSNATWDQTRLTWELMKGRTYGRSKHGYTYSYTARRGIRANERIVFNNKVYRKGQFLPKAYLKKD